METYKADYAKWLAHFRAMAEGQVQQKGTNVYTVRGPPMGQPGGFMVSPARQIYDMAKGKIKQEMEEEKKKKKIRKNRVIRKAKEITAQNVKIISPRQQIYKMAQGKVKDVLKENIFKDTPPKKAKAPIYVIRTRKR